MKLGVSSYSLINLVRGGQSSSWIYYIIKDGMTSLICTLYIGRG